MSTYVPIDWDKVRSIDDVSILPGEFKLDQDTGTKPEGVEYLHHLPHGSKVIDPDGNRFTILGYGSVQGTVILRNRYRQDFHAAGDILLRAA